MSKGLFMNRVLPVVLVLVQLAITVTVGGRVFLYRGDDQNALLVVLLGISFFLLHLALCVHMLGRWLIQHLEERPQPPPAESEELSPPAGTEEDSR